MAAQFEILRERMSPERRERVAAATAAMSAHIDLVADPAAVLQEDTNGCLVACLAMVTGHTYHDVRLRLSDLGCQFNKDGGITHNAVEDYLADYGFAYARKYRWHGANRLRADWPGAAFAPIHIVGVNGGGRHGVVALCDGTVLDPMHREPRTLAEYPEIAYVIGVWKVRPDEEVITNGAMR